VRRVVLFAGGVGGARLAAPLARALGPEDELTIVVNVGDDFEHLGLAISPDLDTVLYHLCGLADTERGWGLRDESFGTLEELRALGGPAWFALGNRDLATHLYRTQRRSEGAPLSTITAELVRARGVDARVRLLPVSDAPVRTMVDTDAGELAFQSYLVERGARDRVRGFRYAGADEASPAPGVVESIAAATQLIVAPSNPYVSILPMLAVPGIARAVAAAPGLRSGLSPLIGARAVKGPLVAMLEALGHPATSFAALTAAGFPLDFAYLDPADAHETPHFAAAGMRVVLFPLVLRDAAADAVARALLEPALPG